MALTPFLRRELREIRKKPFHVRKTYFAEINWFSIKSF